MIPEKPFREGSISALPFELCLIELSPFVQLLRFLRDVELVPEVLCSIALLQPSRRGFGSFLVTASDDIPFAVNRYAGIGKPFT